MVEMIYLGLSNLSVTLRNLLAIGDIDTSV